MKLIISGSRGFTNHELFTIEINKIKKSITQIVSGRCNGPDLWGENYALENGIELKVFPADWSVGKSAGPIRNKQMSQHGDILYAFWDLSSRGTKNMIECMSKLNKPFKIIVL